MLALCLESSHSRGMGHLFRGLSLAEGLRERGQDTLFLVNDYEPALDLIRQRGYPFEVVPLFDRFGWEKEVLKRHAITLWINDRLNTNYEHACLIRENRLPLVSFDDRGDGAVLANLNITGLIFDEPQALLGKCVLSGVDYLILPDEIRHNRRLRTGVRSILVTMGGSDTYAVTIEVVRRLASSSIPVTVVTGPGFEHAAQIEDLLTPVMTWKKGVPSLIAEFTRHDLAITGGGMTPFEAAATGLPSIVIANESFEVPVGLKLAGLGVSCFAGYHAQCDWSVLHRPLPIETMSRAGLETVGLKGRKNVLDAILALLE